MELTTNEILRQTDNGLDFYKFVIPELTQQGNKCKNTKNPFYDDKKPSLSIYFYEGQWLFKDHGEPDFAGDVFSFAAFYYDLLIKYDFPEILTNICNDLNLNMQTTENRQPKSKLKNSYTISTKQISQKLLNTRKAED
jgi:hypothetical protein